MNNSYSGLLSDAEYNVKVMHTQPNSIIIFILLIQNISKFLTTFSRVKSKYQCCLRGGVGWQFLRKHIMIQGFQRFRQGLFKNLKFCKELPSYMTRITQSKTQSRWGVFPGLLDLETRSDLVTRDAWSPGILSSRDHERRACVDYTLAIVEEKLREAFC